MKRPALILAASLAYGLSGLPAPAVALAQTPSELDGAQAYEEDCAQCHRSPERIARRMTGEMAERRAHLETFLTEHHAPDAGTRGAIIDYLLGL